MTTSTGYWSYFEMRLPWLDKSSAWRRPHFRVYWRFGKLPVLCDCTRPLALPVETPGVSAFLGSARLGLALGGLNPAARNTKVRSEVMAQVCDICGKGPQFGNNISHAHNVSRRRWNVNLQAVKALVNGASKRIRVCTTCIKTGKIVKAPAAIAKAPVAAAK